MVLDKLFIEKLLAQAERNPLPHQDISLRTSAKNGSKQTLRALLPGTMMDVHRHKDAMETIICLSGRLNEVLYEEVVSYENASSENAPMGMDAQDVVRKVEYREVQRIHLCPTLGQYGCQIPKETWHTVKVMEPSVILEVKDGDVSCNK